MAQQIEQVKQLISFLKMIDAPKTTIFRAEQVLTSLCVLYSRELKNGQL